MIQLASLCPSCTDNWLKHSCQAIHITLHPQQVTATKVQLFLARIVEASEEWFSPCGRQYSVTLGCRLIKTHRILTLCCKSPAYVTCCVVELYDFCVSLGTLSCAGFCFTFPSRLCYKQVSAEGGGTEERCNGISWTLFASHTPSS